MRRAVVTTAVVAGATVGLSFVLNGVAGRPQVPGSFRPPAAAASGLTPFAGCDALVDWYVQRALPHVGPYGLQGPPVVYGDVMVRDALPMAGAAENAAESSVGGGSLDPQSSSGTGTNVQEVGVDEPDVAKTDGSIVVRVENGELVVTDVRTDSPRELSRLDLPEDMHSPEVLLAGETVLVLQSGIASGGPLPAEPMERSSDVVGPEVVGPELVGRWPGGTVDRSRLVEVSVADPSAPEIESDQSFGGTVAAARQYDEDGGTTVRVVLRTDQPVLDWVQPNRTRTLSEAKQANKEILRASTAEDWLPTVGERDQQRPLVDCSDVAHPATPDPGLGTLTVVSLPADDPTAWRSVGVTSSAATVYSSTDRLYVASSSPDTTQVHAFALEDGATSHSASGEVTGSLRDRWSMDEHDGVLRVALAVGKSWNPDENGITTLRQEGDELVQVGSVRGLGPDEEIKAVRWFDELAVVVTFRETDPLYTVDLADPERPRTLGALKIPGYSGYLHPIGDHRLLGIGQDASLDGATRGAQAAVFDIRDLTDPRRLSTDFLGAHTSAVAEIDPRGFTWLPDSSTALTAVSDPRHGSSDLVALRVGSDGTLSTVDSWPLPGWDSGVVRTLPLGGSRVALVSDEVQVVDVG